MIQLREGLNIVVCRSSVVYPSRRCKPNSSSNDNVRFAGESHGYEPAFFTHCIDQTVNAIRQRR
jgi:hypothetical protein